MAIYPLGTAVLTEKLMYWIKIQVIYEAFEE